MRGEQRTIRATASGKVANIHQRDYRQYNYCQ